MRQRMTVAILAASALQLGGCAVVPWVKEEPAIGIIVTTVEGDPAPYVMYERGKEKQVYCATAWWWAYWWFLPFVIVEGGQMGDNLFDHSVQWWDCLAPYEMAWGPRQRSPGTMQELAGWMSPAPYWVGDKRQTQAPQRWILGNEPMVVAIGTDKVNLDSNSSTYSLVRRAQLDRTATELLVLDKWPPDWSKVSPQGTDMDRTYEASLAKVTRRVQFKYPKTLREILDRRLWEPGANVGSVRISP